LLRPTFGDAELLAAPQRAKLFSPHIPLRMPRQVAKNDAWTRLVILFLWGSPLLGKASAFLGMAIGCLFVFDTRVLLNRWYTALTRRDLLTGFAWTSLISLVYGIAEVIYGVLTGSPLLTALQILAFNFFPLYLFLGVWVGTRRPEIVRQYIRYGAWFIVFYTPLYFLFLNKLHLSLTGILPGSSLDLFSRPGSGTGTLLGLFAFEPNLSAFWLPLVILSFFTIANQIRADWLGLGLALIIWGAATRKLGRVFGIAGLLIGLLLVGFVADVRIPALPGRGGEISARETVARALSSTSPEAAEDLSGSKNTRFYSGTVYWRTVWWSGIREAVSENYRTLIFGLGYGYPIKNLGVADLRASDVRSPHSIFYFTLAYSGVVGVALFFALQFCVLRLLWQTYKETGQIYGLASYAALLVGAFFGNFIETPQGGIPTYLITGLCLGPLFRERQLREQVAQRVSVQQAFPKNYGKVFESALSETVIAAKSAATVPVRPLRRGRAE
jgi:hypothetical protein